MSIVINYSYFEGRDGRERPCRMNKKVLAVVIAGVIGFTSVVPGVSVSAAPEGLEQTRAEYEKLEAKVQGINEKIETLDSEMSLLSEKISKNEDEILNINDEINKTNKEIDSVKEVISEKEDILGQRVREVYKSNGKSDYLNLIFSAKSFGDLINKINAANRIVKLDQKMVNEVVEEKEKLDSKVESLDEKATDIKNLNFAIEKQSKEIQTKKEEQKELVEQAKKEQEKFDEEYLSVAELELVQAKLDICNNADSSLTDLKASVEQLQAMKDGQIKSPTVKEKITAAIDAANPVITQKQAEYDELMSQASSVSLVNRGNVATGNASTDAVISEAYKHLGKPYVWGAKGPSSFDCSGFTSYVYRTALGIEIGGTTYTQINSGIEVSYADLRPGDLVFPHSGHVGIYVGGGQMIHAPHTGDVVKVAPVYKFWRARRILN